MGEGERTWYERSGNQDRRRKSKGDCMRGRKSFEAQTEMEVAIQMISRFTFV